MEQVNSMSALIDRVEEYGRTTFELYKLKAIDQSTTIASSVVTQIVLAVLAIFFIFMLNFGLAFWLGDVIGKTYLGFFAVAGFYALLTCIYLMMRSWVKKEVKDSIISRVAK